MSHLFKPGAALAVVVALGAVAPVQAQKLGSVKGTVVWAGGAIPKREQIKVTQDQAHCTSKGPLYSDSLVVNPKNKGVRWAVAWLVDAKNPRAVLPVPAALKKVVPEKVEVDQPCCMFEPHIITLRAGQSLVVKNSAPVPHNVNLIGGPLGPNLNPIIPPGRSIEVEAAKLRPRLMPINASCSIHNWMKSYIFVFNSPYFAVSDADGNFVIKNVPDGDYKLVVWQESVGWLTPGGTPVPKDIAKPGGGKPIAVRGQTNVGQIPLTPSAD